MNFSFLLMIVFMVPPNMRGVTQLSSFPYCICSNGGSVYLSSKYLNTKYHVELPQSFLKYYSRKSCIIMIEAAYNQKFITKEQIQMLEEELNNQLICKDSTAGYHGDSIMEFFD